MPLSLADFMKLEPDPVPMLVGRGVLPARGKLVIGGPPKSNKSFVAINLMLALAEGHKAFDASYKSGTPVLPVPRKCRVLYLEQELGIDGLQTRLRSIVGDRNLEEIGLFIKSRDTAMRLDTPEGEEYIKAEIAECKPEVVVFDPLAKFHLQDENSAQEMGFVARVADHIIEDYGCAVVMVHHTKKPYKDDVARGGDMLRGSSATFADVDSLLRIERLSGESVKEPILKFEFELRRGEPIEPLHFMRSRSGQIVYMGDEYAYGGANVSERSRKARFARY